MIPSLFRRWHLLLSKRMETSRGQNYLQSSRGWMSWLLRAGSGRRIGTAIQTDASMEATLSQQITASGSLESLQVMNLVSASPVHQRIISVGREPLVEEWYDSIGSDSTSDNHRAFTFEIEQKKHKAHSDVFINDSDYEDFDTVAVSAQLSSVVYIHSSTSLAELNSCADYFKRCMNICCCYWSCFGNCSNKSRELHLLSRKRENSRKIRNPWKLSFDTWWMIISDISTCTDNRQLFQLSRWR